MGKKNKKKKRRLIQRGLIQVLINLSGNPKFKFFKVWDILRETSGFFSRVHICLLRAFPVSPRGSWVLQGQTKGDTALNAMLQMGTDLVQWGWAGTHIKILHHCWSWLAGGGISWSRERGSALRPQSRWGDSAKMIVSCHGFCWEVRVTA